MTQILDKNGKPWTPIEIPETKKRQTVLWKRQEDGRFKQVAVGSFVQPDIPKVSKYYFVIDGATYEPFEACELFNLRMTGIIGRCRSNVYPNWLAYIRSTDLLIPKINRRTKAFKVMIDGVTYDSQKGAGIALGVSANKIGDWVHNGRAKRV